MLKIKVLLLVFLAQAFYCDEDASKLAWDWPSVNVNSNRPGGIAKVDIDHEDALNALKFFEIEAHNLNNVYSQVVAGIKYFYDGSFMLKDASQPKLCKISIVNQPWIEPPYDMQVLECESHESKDEKGEEKKPEQQQTIVDDSAQA